MQTRLPKPFLILLSLLTSVTTLFSQSFFKIVKSNAGGTYMGKLSNGNFFVLGKGSAPIFDGQYFLTFSEVDKNGAIVNFKKSNSSHYGWSVEASAIKRADGKFVIAAAGFDKDSGIKIIQVFTLDEAFNISQVHNISIADAGYSLQLGAHIAQTSDGGYMVITNVAPNEPNPVLKTQNCIVKLDAGFNLLWAKKVNQNAFTTTAAFISSDNKLILSGIIKTTLPAGDYSYIASLDENGNLIKAKTFSATSADYITDVTGVFEDSAGALLLSGVNLVPSAINGTNFLIKMDTGFNMLWAKKYEMVNFENMFNVYGQTGNEYFGVGRRYLDAAYNSRPFFIRIDTAGNLIWQKNQTGLAPSYLDPASHFVRDGNAYYFTGSISSGGDIVGDTVSSQEAGIAISKIADNSPICNTQDTIPGVFNIPVITKDSAFAVTDFNVNMYPGTLAIKDTVIADSFYCGNILPLQLLAFSAQNKGKTNNLSWQTFHETNTAYFDIERSAGGSFTRIGKANATGNNSPTQNYTYTDVQPLQGINYYRLKMVDNDGKFSYSKTVTINNGVALFNAAILPNVVHNSVALQLTSNNPQKIRVDIVGINGGILLSKEFDIAAGTTNKTFGVERLATGTYFIKVTAPASQVNLKMVKQ